MTLVTRARDLRAMATWDAKRRHSEFLDYDQVWCVFDRDDHPHFDEAIKMARDNGLDLAVSNPSMELWLLLHFRDNPGMQHRREVRRMLKEHVPKYDKGVDCLQDYVEGYKWVHLAMKSGNATARELRAALAKMMNSHQIAEAEGLAEEFVPVVESWRSARPM